MKLSAAILARYTPVTQDLKALRDLLDDVGIEVKKVESGIFNLELLANRGDHHCYAGIARELHGRTGAGLTLPECDVLTIGEGPLPLHIESELCLRYTATLLTCDESGALPADVLAPLEAAGIHSLTAPVDATNLSNIELGQPTHAFDADKIVGGITVRLSRPGERAWLLFTEEPQVLPEGMLVIADEEKILAVAGVIGCEDSKTTPETRRLLLESACFDPVTVRKAKRVLDINTDAATRFERGSDPSLPLVGAGRVAYLLRQHAGWQLVGTSGDAGAWSDPARTIHLQTQQVATFLGMPLAAEELSERLSRYGFTLTPTADGFSVVVPPSRLWDVEFRADLYEELARSIGYNNTPTILPAVGMGEKATERELRQERAEEVLLGQGFFEVITDGFYGNESREKLLLSEESPLWAHVSTLNSVEKGYSLLKNNALAQAVEGIADNLRVRHADIKMYEWTRTFHPDPSAENGTCTERALLWAAVCGPTRPGSWAEKSRPADPLFLKGIVADLARELFLPLTVGPADSSDPLHGCLHPNRQAAILLDGERVGIFGEVHPAIVTAHKIKRARPCYLEIDADALQQPARRLGYIKPSVHQPLLRNLAFSLPTRVAAGEVIDALHTAGPDWLTGIAITDRFDYTEDDRALRAITFELKFANEDGTRSSDAVNTLLSGLVDAIHSGLGERGVRQRV
ncbi:MAG: phenylalanyl-tRNA synthetase beta chain [Myxococcota bacterium]|jgi:phenylalanyl-tRNA synthetase beta chain